MSGRFRAWLELARISNLPTCFTNALVGVCLVAPPGTVPWATWGWLCAAIGMLYTGGMILNDVVDANVDAATRRDRPIPSGRVGRRAALLVSVGCLLIGAATVAFVGSSALPWAGALVACIVAYDILHKRFAASVVLMGACRGLVYVLCACAVGPVAHPGPLLSIAAAMTLYIVALTILARREDVGQMRARGLELILPALVLAPSVATGSPNWAWVLVTGLIAVLWLLTSMRHVWRSPIDPRRAVMAWLAAICLADAYFLALLGAGWVVLIAWACFAATIAGHRRILGT